MRTTLVIADDVLLAARAIARAQQKSIGEVVSELARNALRKPESPAVRNGVPLLPRRDGQAPITLEIVNALRDELA
jgi:hypothetical protein